MSTVAMDIVFEGRHPERLREEIKCVVEKAVEGSCHINTSVDITLWNSDCEPEKTRPQKLASKKAHCLTGQLDLETGRCELVSSGFQVCPKDGNSCGKWMRRSH